MKKLLTVGRNSNTGQYFIMGNHGQLENTPYYEKYRDCMIDILQMNGKRYTNIYDMSQRAYEELTT